MDWTALGVSLWLGAGTIAILLPFGVWFGRLLAVHDFRGKLLVEALIKANKDFNLLLLPNQNDGYGTASACMMRRR